LDPGDGELVFHDEDANVWLYQVDCLELMDTLGAMFPDGKFDMIFADPPYFLSNGGITCRAGRMVRVDKGHWDRSGGIESDHDFNLSWLSRCRKLLKPNGTIWVSGTHHVIHSVGYAMQQCRMKIINEICWEKPNPPPNLSCRYFTHSTETLIWAAKNEKSRHVFNYQAMKQQNGGKQMKTVWTIKSPQKREKRHGTHPTQKPVALVDRAIMASTSAGDWILDPFAGSATTGVCAIRQGRKFVGCEADPQFVEIARARLQDALQENEHHGTGCC